MTSQANMLTELATIYLRDPGNNLFPTTIITHALQKAYEQVQHELWYTSQESNQEYSVPIVAWTATYALPSDFVSLRTATIEWGIITGINKDALAHRYIDLTTTWVPRRYYLEWWYFGLFPVPSTVVGIKMYYNRRLPALSSSQASLFPSHYDEAVYRYAAYLCWWPVDNNKALFELQEYQRCVDKIRGEGMYIDENVHFTVSHYTWPSAGLDTVLTDYR